MTRTRNRRSSSRRPAASVGKPHGVLHPRVQHVGPEHFGILCFDCAKARSKFLRADFYGRILLPPTTVAHNRPARDDAVAQVRQAFATHQLHDGLGAIERTGRSHRLVQRALAAPWHLLRHFPTVEQLRAAGVTTLCHSLRQAGIRQVPSREQAAEAKPLAEELRRIQEGRRRGPQVLGDILQLPQEPRII